MQRAFRYRFSPTPAQESLLRRTLGCLRLVCNRALEARSTAWVTESTSISSLQTSAMLTGWKQQRELEFLNELSSVPLQQCLRHLQTAFSNFCSKRARYPNFKKKRNGGSAECSSSGFRWRDGQLFLAKGLEQLPLRWSRQIPEGCIPSSVTVSLPEGIRDWDCPSCGVDHDRDIAQNVLAAGRAVAACGAPVRANSQHRGRHGQ